MVRVRARLTRDGWLPFIVLVKPVFSKTPGGQVAQVPGGRCRIARFRRDSLFRVVVL